MEFSILVEELQAIVSRLSTVVKPNEDGITSMVLIEVGEDVKFKSTAAGINLIITNNKCEITKTGKALVKLNDIKGYVSKFIPLMDDYGTKDFHFIVENDECTIKTKTYFQSGKKPSYRHLKVRCFKGEYLSVKPFGDTQLIINSSIFKRGLSKVLHCINPGEVRKSITGVNVTIKEDGVVFTGTNGVKLEEFELPINADIEKSSYIFSYNFASILRAILDDDAQVFINLEGRNVYIKSNDMYIVGGLIINESYPNYRAMFDLDSVITFSRIDFADTVHTVMDVLDDEDNSRLSIKFTDNKLIMNNDVVESVQEFDTIFEDSLDIDINGAFLDSILNDFSSELLELHFTKGNNYIVFKSPDSDKQSALLTVVKRR